MRRTLTTALAVLVAVCAAAPAARGQVNGVNGGATINGKPVIDLSTVNLSGLLPLAYITPGTVGQVLTMGATYPEWAAASGGISGLTATRIPVATGATSIADDAGLTYITGSDTLSVQGPVVLGIDAAGGISNTAGQFKLFSAGDNAYYTTITAGTQSQTVAYTLPVDDGAASTFLQTDGSGVLSWVAQAAEVDGVVGNEVINATNSTLTRSGTGTGGDPYTLGLNLSSGNSWAATQTVPDLAFSGTTTTGLHLKTLTTTQRDAVSPVATAGDMVYNSTTGRVEAYDGAAWHGRVRLDGDTMTGALVAPTVTVSSAGGVELVTNGTFTGAATGWTLGGGGGAPDWAYATNNVTHGASGGTTAIQPSTPLTVVAGTLYRVTFTISGWSAGTLTAAIGGVSGSARGANGKYVEFLLATGTTNLTLTPTTTLVATVDDVSVTAEDRLRLTNANVTTSTATVERSPAICAEGHAWDTDGSDDKWQWMQYMTQTSAATTTSAWTWASSKNNAAATTALSLSDSGTLTATLGIAAGTLTSNGTNNSGLGFLRHSSTITTSTGQTILDLRPTYAQTGSPANTDIYVRRTETALGTADARTGAQLLMDLGAGSTSMFRVDNSGRTTARNYGSDLVADAIMQPFSVVMADAGTDGRFDINTAGAALPIGVVWNLTGATAQGTTYSVVTAGLTYVIPDEDVTSVTRGHVAIVDASLAGMVDDSATLGTAGTNVGRYLYSEAAITFDAEADVNPAANTIVLDSTPTWVVGDPVVFWASGDTQPVGLVSGTVYWIRSISTATVTLQTSRGGAVTDITADGSGTTCYLMRLPQVILHWQ